MPEAIQYMPKGKQSIYATVNNKAGYAPLNVTRETAEVLQRDLETIQAEVAAGKRSRPVLYFDHKTGPAAGIPKKFSWDDEKGVLLELDWTGAGRDAVMNQNYSYFSPTFRVDMETGEVLGLHRDATEVGSLVNRPAIENIGLIAAARPEGEEQPPAYGVVVEVMAANPFGCNQYGEGWAAPHEGNSTTNVPGAGKVATHVDENGNVTQKTAPKKPGEKDYTSDRKPIVTEEQQKKIDEVAEKKEQKMQGSEKQVQYANAILAKGINLAIEAGGSFVLGELTIALKKRHGIDTKTFTEGHGQMLMDMILDKQARKLSKDKLTAIVDKWKSGKKAHDIIEEGKPGGSFGRYRYETPRAPIDPVASAVADTFASMLKKKDGNVKASLAEYVTAALAGEDLSPRGGVAEGEKKPDNGDTAKGGGFTTMDEELKKRLGCDEKADDAAVTAAMIKCMDERDELQKKLDALKGEKDKVDAELKAAKAEAADAFVNDLKARNVIAPHDEARISAAKAVFEANPAQARALFDGVALTTPGSVTEGSILAGKPEGAGQTQTTEDPAVAIQKNIMNVMGLE